MVGGGGQGGRLDVGVGGEGGGRGGQGGGGGGGGGRGGGGGCGRLVLLALQELLLASSFSPGLSPAPLPTSSPRPYYQSFEQV